ncbi:MAG TPA: ATP-binding protein [Gemmatimonadales bacterium]|nr:ATP-binding protein [Gemmatimonadales bacterium]
MTSAPAPGQAAPGRLERETLRSLRVRIPLWYGGLVALCLLAYSLAIVAFFTRHLSTELDRRAHEDVELASRSFVVSDQGRVSWRGGSPPWAGVHEEPGGGHWLEVWSPAGERLLADGTEAPIDLGPPPGPGAGDRPAHTLRLPIGSVRVLAEEVTVKDRTFLVRVAVSEAPGRAQVRLLWVEVIGLSLGVLLLGGLGGFLIARRALAPLTRMAERAHRITAEQLHERLPAEGGSLELDQLATAFNETFARLEGSFGQLRRFTADVSHELRTPLTALRTVGEVGLRGSRDATAYREVIGSMLEEVDRLTRLVDELLTLARADAGEAKLHLEPLDLAVLAREVAGHLSVLAEEREQVLEVETQAPVPVRGDRTALRLALVNLVVNAIKYAPERTRIRVAAGCRDGHAYALVADQGPGIAAEDRDRVFERFYRVDKSRSRDMGGTGLGLALVKWAAEAHGGRAELETELGRGSTFTLVLPADETPRS